MTESEHPLSVLLGQGWEIGDYSSAFDASGIMHHSFLLRRQKQTKLLIVRKKVMGAGLIAEEVDV